MSSGLKGCSIKRQSELTATKRDPSQGTHIHQFSLVALQMTASREEHTSHRFNAGVQRLYRAFLLEDREPNVTQLPPHLHVNAAALHEIRLRYVSFVLAASPTRALAS
jgi:hypothetical protein